MNKVKGYATIDMCLAVVKTGDLEIAIDTANKLEVAPQVETQDAIKLIKDGRLLAQKPGKDTITSHQLTLTDNIFYPEIVAILQGGTVSKDADGNTTYEPPVSGSNDSGQVFEFHAYSAVYDEAGDIVNYEKTIYPNCKGTPVTLNTEDNVFRIPEYVINSYAKKGQASYKITYVSELPTFTDVPPAVSEISNLNNVDAVDETRLTV